MIKRIFSICLCFALLVSSVLVMGCSGNQGVDADTTETVAVTYAEGDTYVAPDVDYGGKDFDVFTWAEEAEREWVLELTPELSKVDSETYYHLSTVEQELNLNFVTHTEKGNYDYRGDFVSKLAVLSGDDGIDLVCQYSLTASVGAQQGLYANLLELDYIKWDAEYWSKNLKETNTVNDKMFWCTGDMTASVLRRMFLFVFNYSMAEDYQMGNLYDIVKDGKWTLETVKTLTANVYSDDNNNKKRDKGDTFGFVGTHNTTYDAFQYGCDLYCIVTNNMGELEVNPELYGDRGVAVTDKIKDFFHNNGDGCYVEDGGNQYGSWTKPIEEEKAVFSLYTANDIITSLVTTEVNYGILPIPKYDEEQETYHTCLAMPHSLFSVPLIAPDPDVSAAVLESMAHNGYVSLSPKVFEALQYRYAKRVEDVEMLTILRDGIIFEPGRSLDTINIFALVRAVVRDNISITQKYAESKKMYETGIEEVNFMFS